MGQLALKWAGGDTKMFIGRDSSGHLVVTGHWTKDGDESWTDWRAVKPSDLLVLSLAACSGYDVVMIMKGRARSCQICASPPMRSKRLILRMPSPTFIYTMRFPVMT